jgi:lipopolysaccharide transport system permease protein
MNQEPRLVRRSLGEGGTKNEEQRPLARTIYTPDTGLKDPRALFAGIWQDTFSPQSRELAWRLTTRSLAGQFRQSLLGYFWLFFPPLLNSVIFVFLQRQQILKMEATVIPYAVFVLLGNLLWQSFMQAMQSPIKAVQRELSILTKLNISREAVLLSGFYEMLITSAIPFIALPLILIAFRIPFTVMMLLAPVGFLGFVLFGYAIGVWLTPIGLLYKDIGQAIPIIMRFMMFVTPVVYPLPKEPGFARTLLLLNPTTPFIETARNWMTGQVNEMSGMFMVYSLLSVVFLIAGLVVYRLAMPIIIERMSS